MKWDIFLREKRRGFAANPTRELSSLDLPLRYRVAIADVKLVQTAATRRRESEGLVPQAGLGGSPKRPRKTSPLDTEKRGRVKMARPAFPVAYFFSNFSLNRSALSRM